MKNFKKALCLVLALAMTVAMLAACGSKDDANTDGDSAKKTFIMGVDPSIPPSATSATTVSSPASTWRVTPGRLR
ncbi:MAG: hypothetical protein V8S81_10865 [Oscillospiraceae bacterium]